MANDNKGAVDYPLTLRNSYDVVEEALRVMPIAGAGFSIELSEADGDTVATRPISQDSTALLTAQSAGADFNSSNVDILYYKGYFISISWTGLDTTDSILKLQAGNDGTLFHDATSVTLSTASGNHFFQVTEAFYKFFRLNFDNGTNTTGTISATYVVKA